jgi:dTDP-4-amino-4,6-dideoxygalactose transaminase
METSVESLWSSAPDTMVCLSVRSGLDLFLQTMNFPKGSEVLVSAVTIRDMIRIIEHHGLVPVPVDIDMECLTVKTDALRRAITPKTKAILVAHLFGSVMPLDEAAAVAREHGLPLLEDCAQSFTGLQYRGHPGSDISLFSFGPIKTATALGGAILRINDPALRDRMKARQAKYPVQERWKFLKRTFRFALVLAMMYRWTFGLLYAACQLMGKNHDELVSHSIRGFSGPEFFVNIRYQPSYPLLALLRRRLRNFDGRMVKSRVTAAHTAIQMMPNLRRPGQKASAHSFWTFPVLTEQPDEFARRLWSRGFDTTRGTWSLYAVPVPAQGHYAPPSEVEEVMRQILYLPVVFPGVSTADLGRLAIAAAQAEGQPHDESRLNAFT